MASPNTNAQSIAALLMSAEGSELLELCERYKDDPRKVVQRACSSARKRYEVELAERARVASLYETMHHYGGDGIVLGVDEVGRGSVAGPLTVCACVLPNSPQIMGLNDSKQVSPKQREILATKIAGLAHAIGISHIDPASIDALGMSVSLRMAMKQAIEDAGVESDAVLIDGNPVHVHDKECCVVHGDARIACIAAASIVAKVTRDHAMKDYAQLYPEYGFEKNKGYASAEHIAAIKKYGLSPIHRVSFCGSFLETQTLFS